MFRTTQGIPTGSETTAEVVSVPVRVPRVALDIVGTVWGSFIFCEILMGFHDFGGWDEDPLKVA